MQLIALLLIFLMFLLCINIMNIKNKVYIDDSPLFKVRMEKITGIKMEFSTFLFENEKQIQEQEYDLQPLGEGNYTSDGWTCLDTCDPTCAGVTCYGTCDQTCIGLTCGSSTCFATCAGLTCGTSTCDSTCCGETCGSTCIGSSPWCDLVKIIETTIEIADLTTDYTLNTPIVGPDEAWKLAFVPKK